MQRLTLRQTITLTRRNCTAITFTWDTTGYAMGIYTITATARPLPSETYTTDNTHPNGWVIVTGKGDVNGDRVVNALDRIKVAISFGPS